MEDSSPKFTNHFPSNTAIVIVILFGISLIGAWNFYKKSTTYVPPSPAQNAVVRTLPTVSPTSMPIAMKSYEDTQFSFRYDSDLFVENSTSSATIYLATEGKKYVEADVDYQIEMKAIRKNIPSLAQLRKIASGSAESMFIADSTSTSSGKMTIVHTRYKDGWSLYEKYIVHSPKLVVYFTGTGKNHERLSRIIDSFQLSDQSVGMNDVKTAGTISQVDTSCFADGVCRVKVGTNWLILESGGDATPEMVKSRGEQGLLLGDDGITPISIGDLSVGTKVEIFARKTDATTLSLYGKKEYYVKVLKQ